MSVRCECSGDKCRLSSDDPRHGTENGYKNLKCRCSSCRSAHATYIATLGKTAQRRHRLKRQIDNHERKLVRLREELNEIGETAKAVR